MICYSFYQPSVASEMTGQSFYAASSASMYGGFSRSVFGSVSGRSSPESVSEDLAEPSSGYHDKFATSLGGIFYIFLCALNKFKSVLIPSMIFLMN